MGIEHVMRRGDLEYDIEKYEKELNTLFISKKRKQELRDLIAEAKAGIEIYDRIIEEEEKQLKAKRAKMLEENRVKNSSSNKNPGSNKHSGSNSKTAGTGTAYNKPQTTAGNNGSTTPGSKSTSFVDSSQKGNQLDLQKIYNEQKESQDNSRDYEARCLQHLGPLVKGRSVSNLDVCTREISCQTNTRELFLQAASLVKPSIWREDGYTPKVLKKTARPHIIYSGGFNEDKDKHNIECYVVFEKQRFVHQYRWHDQSLHLYNEDFWEAIQLVPKRVFGIYTGEIAELIKDRLAPISRVRELAHGSQKYVRLRYTSPTSDYGCIDDNNAFYLFSDGHVYDSDAGSGSYFKLILSNNVEETMRFIVKQIIALNEQNKWNINDVTGGGFRY